jgi:hypothetical protein
MKTIKIQIKLKILYKKLIKINHFHKLQLLFLILFTQKLKKKITIIQYLIKIIFINLHSNYIVYNLFIIN